MKALIFIMCLVAGWLPPAQAANGGPVVRIQDIANFEGVRKNVLMGYGLIVGLAGTGDSANSIPFTRQTLVNMLQKMGVNARDVAAQLKTKNVAAVMVTAEMPSLARQGTELDVTVSSLGDAASLQGGMLLATPLAAADGETYAVAQGSVVVGGFVVEGENGRVERNHPTVGRIADGATIERETGFELAQLGKSLSLTLKEPDFTTAIRMAKAINHHFKREMATAKDNGTISIALPTAFQENPTIAMEKIGNLHVRPSTRARVVIDEKTGTIVMGQDVRIANVAISHANITIKVEERTITPPVMFNFAGERVQNPETIIKVEEEQDPEKGRFRLLDGGASLADLVKGLNALGVRPRDVISILQNIKAAGALQAELVVL